MTGTKKILEADFSSGSYTFIEEKLLGGIFGEAEYKGQNTAHFNILDSLL